MNIKKDIQTLKIVALLLFIFPVAAIIGSLIFHNVLVSFKFYYEEDYKFLNYKPGEIIKYECNEKNIFCDTMYFNKFEKLNNCGEFIIEESYILNNDEIYDWAELLNKKKENNFFIKYKIADVKNLSCIKNTKHNKLYNIAPFIFEFSAKIKYHEKTTLGTNKAVIPMLYGETSISNIVKRFPVSYIFKPLMFITVFVMVMYWRLYSIIFNNILSKNEIKYFLIFGILSAFFLFFHVIFLGSEFQNEIFTKMRRLIIVSFILFELLAQIFLVKEIYSKKNIIYQYVHLKIIYLKLAFIIFVVTLSVSIIFILIFYNLDAKIDYILEWNYFLLLLVFYFLSSIMWKKN